MDRTITIGDEVHLLISGPCPRRMMTTLPQDDLPTGAAILRPAAQHSQANVGVYADGLQPARLAATTVSRSPDRLQPTAKLEEADVEQPTSLIDLEESVLARP